MSNSFEENYFAAFIMTYERPWIIAETIENIFGQTLPPQKILIVDNSVSYDTKDLVEKLNNPRIEYYRVGENIGPAGASKIGLEKLTEQGFKWIYWVDDDDPPFFPDTLERLLKTANRNEITGIVGAVGHYFDKKRGIVVRVQDNELSKPGDIEIDVIAGNMVIIVNSDVVKKGVLPDPGMFLNIEEYDYCLRVKQAGYKIMVPRDVYFAYRNKKKRFDLPINPSPVFPPKSVLWRKYYSTRNLIYILTQNEKSYIGAIRVSGRAVGKALMGFKKGMSYGLINAKMELKGILHGWLKMSGRRVLPNKKY